MKTTLAALSLVATLLASATTATRTASAEPGHQSASGSGQFHLGLPLRTFSFSAQTAADGTAGGEAQLDNRASGARDHFEIDCLNVLGDIAVMSGIVRSSVDPTLVGTDVLFAVRDNGEGPGAPPDEISLAFTGLAIACTDITDLASLDPFLVPIEQGQVRVRP
jgi:hypothetical protein